MALIFPYCTAFLIKTNGVWHLPYVSHSLAAERFVCYCGRSLVVFTKCYCVLSRVRRHEMANMAWEHNFRQTLARVGCSDCGVGSQVVCGVLVNHPIGLQKALKNLQNNIPARNQHAVVSTASVMSGRVIVRINATSPSASLERLRRTVDFSVELGSSFFNRVLPPIARSRFESMMLKCPATVFSNRCWLNGSFYSSWSQDMLCAMKYFVSPKSLIATVFLYSEYMPYVVFLFPSRS